MFIKKIPLKVAAYLMGKNYNFVRIGLQRGVFPFGSAIRTHQAPHSRYTYYISPKKFMEYTGATEEDILNAAKINDVSVL